VPLTRPLSNPCSNTKSKIGHVSRQVGDAMFCPELVCVFCFTCQQTAFVDDAIECNYQDSKGKMESIVKEMCELNSTL
jgi:hypothetical protein